MIHIWNQVCQGISFFVSSLWPSTPHLIEVYTKTRDEGVLRTIGLRRNAFPLLIARYRGATTCEVPRTVDAIEEMLHETLRIADNKELIKITATIGELPHLQLFLYRILEKRPETTIVELARFLDNSSLMREDRHITAGYVYFKIEFADSEQLTHVVFDLDPQSKFWRRAARSLLRNKSYDPVLCKRIRERASSHGVSISTPGGDISHLPRIAHE